MIPLSSFGTNSISWNSEEDLFSVQYENTTVKDILNYIVIPTLGFIAVFLMWLEIEAEALKWGLIWGMIGVAYLAYKTGGFTRPAPQYNEFEDR